MHLQRPPDPPPHRTPGVSLAQHAHALLRELVGLGSGRVGGLQSAQRGGQVAAGQPPPLPSPSTHLQLIRQLLHVPAGLGERALELGLRVSVVFDLALEVRDGVLVRLMEGQAGAGAGAAGGRGMPAVGAAAPAHYTHPQLLLQLLDLLAERVGLGDGLVQLDIVSRAIARDARARRGEVRRTAALPLQLVRDTIKLLLEARDGVGRVVAFTGVLASCSVGAIEARLQRLEGITPPVILLQEAVVLCLEVANALLGDLGAIRAGQT